MKKFTSDSQKIGQLGEDVACKFLMKHNFLVLERNYTKKWGEIDIIAKKNSKIHFIEVKTPLDASGRFMNFHSQFEPRFKDVMKWKRSFLTWKKSVKDITRKWSSIPLTQTS